MQVTRKITATWERPGCKKMRLAAWVNPSEHVTLLVERDKAEELGYTKAGVYKLTYTKTPGAHVNSLTGRSQYVVFRNKVIGAKEEMYHIPCCFLPWRNGTLVKRELRKA